MTYISAFMPRDEKGFITEDVVYVYECINHKNILKKYPAIFEYYTKSERGEYTSIFGESLTKIVYNSTREFRIGKKEALGNGEKLYESDIQPETKVLMEHYYGKPAPDLNVLFYDIEVDYVSRKYNDNDIVTIRTKADNKTYNEELKLIRELDSTSQKHFELYDDMLKKWVDYEDSRFSYMGETGFSRPLNPYAPINAISIYKQWKKESIVLAVPPKGWDISQLDQSLLELAEIRFFKTEKELLMEYLSELEDANVISGYNSSYFDDPYVAKRVELVLGDYFFKKLSMKKANIPQFREVFVKGKKELQVQYGGRAQLDYLELFKKFEQDGRASYKLEAISGEVLPHLSKLEYTGTLEQLYHNDFNHFLRYNIRDTEILNGFEQKLNYIKLANDMIHSNTSNFNNIFGTVRVVDNSIINYCHHVKNVIVPDKWDTADGSIQGAYVLYPQKGMHRWICAIDINSLYPSAMRAINISPETMIGQFIENMQAWKCISERVENDLVFRYENGVVEVKSTSEWIELFLSKKWAVSGYGTVYDQNEEGVIPSLLASWYSLRKEYQALKKKFSKMCDDVKLEHGTLSAKQLKEHEKLDESHKKEYKLKHAKLSKEHQKQYDEYYEESKKNDRFQYIYKILLNSTYGCLSNYNFRFFRLEAGESVTGTGRMILKHQCREVNKLLEGNYNIEFPLYESKKVIDKMIKVYNKKMAIQYIEDKPEVSDGASLHSYMDTYSQEYYHPSLLSHEIALDGPVFKGNFTSKSIIYGDTDSTYFVVPAKDKEEAVEMSDFIAERVNKSYPKFMKHAFLCQPVFDKMIACGREIVGDNSIFVNKKLYTIRVVDNEGKAEDKIKTMGLAIKKTTLPKPIANKLTSFVKRLLIGEDWSTISRDVVDYKKDLKNLDNILEMGLPKGVNGLEDYYKKYLDNGETNLPGHVAASIFYNMNLQEYEDYDNAPITSGNKIKVYYLKKPIGRFKAISLPTDLETVPEWFTEHFINKLDIDLQISKLVDDPFESILNAIDYKVPTEQLLLMEDAFEWD
jgi:DNA polymerase elongation subunit (family B)